MTRKKVPQFYACQEGDGRVPCDRSRVHPGQSAVGQAEGGRGLEGGEGDEEEPGALREDHVGEGEEPHGGEGAPAEAAHVHLGVVASEDQEVVPEKNDLALVAIMNVKPQQLRFFSFY